MSNTLIPSNLSPANLASTLRDAAELVVDATTASAKSISAALPDSMPELAASLPAAIPFVGNQQSRRRSSRVRQLVIVGAIVAVVAGAAIVLKMRAQRRSAEAIESAEAVRPAEDLLFAEAIQFAEANEN